MKASQLIKLLMLLVCTSACANKKPREAVNSNNIRGTSVPVKAGDTIETGKVIAHVFCEADAAQSYALYIPAKGNNEALPVVYFFDPHADGSLPLKKYKALADRYHFILAGSNNSKNGNNWPTDENIWNTFFDDSQKRLKINTSRIYTCGFSGGAKVAGYVALNHHEIRGVLANGAGLPDGTAPGNFNFSFTAIAGEGDMNMTDLVAASNDLDKTQTRHRIIIFDGKHEWAPQNTMDIAFGGLQLDAMRDKQIPRNDAFINNYIAASKKKIGDLINASNYVKAEAECQLSISMLDGLTDEAGWFKQKDASLKTADVYKKQWQNKQNLFVTEQNMKAEYMQQFTQANMNYWHKTVGDLQDKAKLQTAEGAMYQRLLAYLSLAFYSISNQLINGKQYADAAYFVGLYKMVDSTNSEAWYFSAIVNAHNNDLKAAEDDLMRAIRYGFSDENRMTQQPEFGSGQINFTEMEKKMKQERNKE